MPDTHEIDNENDALYMGGPAALVPAEEVLRSGEVVPRHRVQMGMLQANTPGEFVKVAADLAGALADIIRQRKLFSTIQGREFVKAEGWTTLAAMLGVTPREVSVVEHPEGVFTATVELRRVGTDEVVGRASAECGSKGEEWAGRPRNARRSMALTRATSKACRLAFSWVMVLAGYEATPAEEMNDGQPIGGGQSGGENRPGGGSRPTQGYYQPPHSAPAKITPDQLRSLRLKLRLLEMAGDKDVEARMCHWLHVPTITDCPAEAFEKAMHVLERKVREAGAGEGSGK
jgi:hypothetical protein